MILVDTSVWIDHFRRSEPGLIQAASASLICQHPFVTAELALGSIPRRETTLQALNRLAQVTVLTPADILTFVEQTNLYGTGVGMVDAYLLATAAIEKCQLWTRDRRLRVQAERLHLAFTE